MDIDNGYRLVTTTDGNIYFGTLLPVTLLERYQDERDPVYIDGVGLRLKACCMLEMIGVGKHPLDIAALGLTEGDNVNITQCVNVSIFNPSLCVDVPSEAADSILSLITLKRNQELARLTEGDK